MRGGYGLRDILVLELVAYDSKRFKPLQRERREKLRTGT